MPPRRFLLSALALAAGCAASSPPAPRPPPPAPLTLAAAEAALLATSAWRVDATIRATGAVAADLTATVIVARGNRVRIETAGTFAGAPGAMTWKSDGARTSTGAATPADTALAVTLGATRMGLLHNVARLLGGEALPDHADGGADAWVRPVDPRPLGDGQVGFGLEVDGAAVADVTVGLVAPGPTLTARRITVHFDGGDMTVDETYRFQLDYELPSDQFVLGGGP